MTDREHAELTRQRLFYAEQAAQAQSLADALDVWAQRLASALFLTLCDRDANYPAASSVLREYREWAIEWESKR